MDKGVEGTLGPRALTELQSLGYFIVVLALLQKKMPRFPNRWRFCMVL